MSKSYAKNIKFGPCGECAQNTDYYKEKRKRFRYKAKQAIRDTLAHYDVEDFDENYKPHTEVFKDDWNEPSDGTITFTATDKRLQCYDGVYVTKNKKIKK